MSLTSKLFEPVRIGEIEIKNRLAMAPLAKTGLVTSDGIPTERAIDYYAERIKGNIGLIITGVAKVEKELEKRHGGRMLITPDIVPPLAELAEFAHHCGTKLFVQLTAGEGRNNPGVLRDPSADLVSASEVPSYWNPSLQTRALEIDEIKRLIVAFSTATSILKQAGVDGVELNGHEGYLLDQFTTSIWNKRKDEYGGELKARLTFPIEVLEAIKLQGGKNFPVIYRYGLKHYIRDLRVPALNEEEFEEVGRDIGEGVEMAKLLEEAGFDALDVDAGCYDSWYWAHPPVYQEHGCLTGLAEKVKKAVKIPVITSGRLEIPRLAEEIIVEGKADVVALGRGLLADPYWLKKLQEGRSEDIRPCIGCHEGCLQRIVNGKPLSCAVNPACGRETLYRLKPTHNRKRVLVIGGGLAGMEAARVASLRGHKVHLCEREKSLGGHLIEASVPAFKQDVRHLLEWYRTQLDKLDLEVTYDMEVKSNEVEHMQPDVVIVATGSFPYIPDIKGIDKGNVGPAREFLLGRTQPEKEIVVIGGGLVGLETALWLAQKGKTVTVVEMLSEVANDVPLSNRQMLLDLLAYHGVHINTGIEVSEITDHGVQIVENGERTIISCNHVALATGFEPSDEVYNSLKNAFSEVFRVGDCCKPGKIMSAIWSAYDIARLI